MNFYSENFVYLWSSRENCVSLTFFFKAAETLNVYIYLFFSRIVSGGVKQKSFLGRLMSD